MDKAYEFQDKEKQTYAFWEKEGFFTPKIDKNKKPYVITLPPPNVTGELHLGHALYAIEDILIRYNRMLGKPTLWLPGFDHASIAVHTIIDKRLAKMKKTRKDVGKEEFLRLSKDFANQSRDYIRKQLKLLGFSLDWTREVYTIDEKRTKAVKHAFNLLYKEGLIYQGERIINWCPKCQTALSDLENEHKEEKGKLYFIKYGPITIATTRPETIFADTAIAIHPKNKKYKNLLGKEVVIPLTDRKIPIIKDDLVDPSFGTGAVKITPGHDPLDFEIGLHHNLETLMCINQYGKLTDIAGEFSGLKAIAAREKIVEQLKKQGFLEKTEEHIHAVGHCQRCAATTEPTLSKQWFVKAKILAKPAIEAVKSGEIEIIPKRFEKIYFQWLENIRDWCISRQLWWGHPIPIKKEEDVLDTWFSSGLWPFSTLGWPEKTEDFEYFYPTTLRETGYDILFFWVAREIMMALFLTGKIPYKKIYLHGLVRDEKGQKMSKSKGNVIDPLPIIEKFGTDALRMSLIVGNTPGTDLSLSEEKIKGYRNFANKIWNASRFVLLEKCNQKDYSPQKVTQKDDKLILSELEKIIKKTTILLEKYRFDLAAEKLYHFFWHTFCDKYIETTKKRRAQAQPTLLFILSTSLKLLHPFMPFVTESVWQIARKENENFFKSKALIIAPWPKIKS